jgi:predicted RecA/RadA family phage recombinase
MSKNDVYRRATQLQVACTDPAVPNTGDPVLYGQRPGVCLVTEDANGNATVAFEGAFALSVKGIDGAGNHAVAEGDIIYYTAADTPKLSVKATGVRFGYAGPGGAITSGSTATITVILGY